MKSRSRVHTLFLLFSFACVIGTWLACKPAVPSDTRTIAKSALEDKIRGGWAGKMIGVSFGAPTEFNSNGKIQR